MIRTNRIVVGQKPNQGRRIFPTIIAPRKSQRLVRANRFIFGGRFRYSSELLMPHGNAQRERKGMVSPFPIAPA
jgi:hypothetical protein